MFKYVISVLTFLLINQAAFAISPAPQPENAKYSKEYKIIITIVILALTLVIVFALIAAVKSIAAYYKSLTNLFNGMY